MKKNLLLIDGHAHFSEIKDINPSFASARVSICYPGRNRNKSDISKDVLTKAIPSLYNVPIVGRYDEKAKDFGAHDMRIHKDEDTGRIIIENATVPFGVVPESADISFETITEPDGTEREYLCTDVYLWKRQPGYECILEKKRFGQSMEINVTDYIIDSEEYVVIQDMTFEALCILGDAAEPCFECAAIQLNEENSALEYALSEFKKEYFQMLNELKTCTASSSDAFSDTTPEEGGQAQPVNIDKDNEQTLATAETQTVEEVDGVTDVVSMDNVEPTDGDAADTNTESAAKKAFTTYNEKREALRTALSALCVYDDDHLLDYWMCDFDDNYIYVEKYEYVNNENTHSYGRFTYVMNDGAVALSDYTEMFITWLTAEEKAQIENERAAAEALKNEFDVYKETHSIEDSTYNEYVESHSHSNEEYNLLATFKANIESEQHRQQVDEILAEFNEDLGKIEEYKNLVENAYEMSCEDLLRDCYLLRGKYKTQKQFSFRAANKVVLPAIDVEKDDKPLPYGGVFEKYRNRIKN